jgi:Peptidase propeptide and YPEB domain
MRIGLMIDGLGQTKPIGAYNLIVQLQSNFLDREIKIGRSRMKISMSSLMSSAILLALISLPAFGNGQSKTSQAELSKEAKVTMEQAQKTALAKEAGKVKSKEIEREKGRLIYSFDIKTADGLHEVNVDAMTGEIMEDTVENAAAEAQEKAADKAEKAKQKSSPPNQ